MGLATTGAVTAACTAVIVALFTVWIGMVGPAVPDALGEGVIPATSLGGFGSEGNTEEVSGSKTSTLQQRKAAEVVDTDAVPQDTGGGSKTSEVVETDAVPQDTGGGRENQNTAKKSSKVVVVYPSLPAVAREGAKVWSPEELALYDGSDTGRPLLLAIVGEVYEVSAGQRFYEPGMGYAGATGHDASRAFATGAFQGKDVTSKIDDLKSDQIGEVLHWRGFYRDHEQYRFVGVLNERYFGPDGAALETLAHVDELKKFQEAAAKIREKFNKRLMSCNSRTGPGLYHEIWCDDSYHQPGSVPAHVYYELPAQGPVPAQDGAKCSCVPTSEREALDREAASLAERPRPGKVTFRIVDYPECAGAQRCKRKKTAEPP